MSLVLEVEEEKEEEEEVEFSLLFITFRSRIACAMVDAWQGTFHWSSIDESWTNTCWNPNDA